MGNQTIKQRARRTALDVQVRVRAERAEKEKRLGDLAVRVLTAVGERNAAVIETEQRAGEALAEMTEGEGLTLREAVEWCGEQITLNEATRLRRSVNDSAAASATTAELSGSAGSGQDGSADADTATR